MLHCDCRTERCIRSDGAPEIFSVDMPNRALRHLFENNRKWVAQTTKTDPTFFRRLAALQKPKYLWIGCADSRMPPNELLGLMPGEVFVHRNVSNLVDNTDMNCLSVVQYAIEVLKVEHVIVCGHYGCGGIHAAMQNQRMGLIDHWLRSVKDVYRLHEAELNAIKDVKERANRLAELNVREQTRNVCHTEFVQRAWHRNQPLAVHGWIFDIADGIVKDLGMTYTRETQLQPLYRLEDK